MANNSIDAEISGSSISGINDMLKQILNDLTDIVKAVAPTSAIPNDDYSIGTN